MANEGLLTNTQPNQNSPQQFSGYKEQTAQHNQWEQGGLTRYGQQGLMYSGEPSFKSSEGSMYGAIQKREMGKFNQNLGLMKQKITADQDVKQFGRYMRTADTANKIKEVERQKRFYEEMKTAQERKSRAGFMSTIGAIGGGILGAMAGGPVGAAAGAGMGGMAGQGMA